MKNSESPFSLREARIAGRPLSIATVTLWLILLGLIQLFVLVPTLQWLISTMNNVYSQGKHIEMPSIWLVSKEAVFYCVAFLLIALVIMAIGVALWLRRTWSWIAAFSINAGTFLIGVRYLSHPLVSIYLLVMAFILPIFSLSSESAREFSGVDQTNFMRSSLIVTILSLSIYFSGLYMVEKMDDLSSRVTLFTQSLPRGITNGSSTSPPLP